MLVVLKPLRDAVGIERIDVATYQSVSGAGRRHMEELARQTALLLNGKPVESDIYPRQIAFNVIPQIDVFEKNGFTREEMKMVWETQKIFGDSSIQVNATAVRVPVFFGHSEAIHLRTREPIAADVARDLLSRAPGVQLLDDPDSETYPTAVGDAAGHDPVYVGRVRDDLYDDCGLNLWVVADNVRKGAATNSVQIAELLVKNYL
jgi:aspartate-semialdehyde dehydrogenase